MCVCVCVCVCIHINVIVIVIVKFISKYKDTYIARRTKVCRHKKSHKSILVPNIYVTIRYTFYY